MILPDVYLADLVRRHGFHGDEIIDAIAMALGASGGEVGYDHQVLPGPTARYVGLWALDTVAAPDYAAVDLHDPDQAAEVAWELTTATGSWRWCPAGRTGIAAQYRPRAALVQHAVIGPVPVQRPEVADGYRRIGAARMLDTARRSPVRGFPG